MRKQKNKVRNRRIREEEGRRRWR